MRKISSQTDIEKRREIWQGIRWWMNRQGVTPNELAQRTKYPQDRLERGLRGEPEPIAHALLDFVYALNPPSARGKFYEEGYEILTDDELKNCLKPPPPRQRSFWDDRIDW